MTHQEFKERLEEIQAQVNCYCYHETGCSINGEQTKSIESLIALFEDYTKEIVEYLPKEVKAEMPNITTYAYNRAIKDVRQTINQTSKTILRNEE